MIVSTLVSAFEILFLAHGAACSWGCHFILSRAHTQLRAVSHFGRNESIGIMQSFHLCTFHSELVYDAVSRFATGTGSPCLAALLLLLLFAAATFQLYSFLSIHWMRDCVCVCVRRLCFVHRNFSHRCFVLGNFMNLGFMM